MPPSSPRKSKDRFSDPSNASLSPLHGKFSKASTGSRAQSLSPRKRDSKQPLHIRMNLTETQVNRITDAFTRRVDGSSTGAPNSIDESPSKAAAHVHKPSPSKHRNKYSLESSDFGSRHSELVGPSGSIPHSQGEASSYSLAQRRQKETPAPIHVKETSRLVRATPQRVRMQVVQDAVSPLSPREMYEATGPYDNDRSVYTTGCHSSQRPEPLSLRVKTPEFQGPRIWLSEQDADPSTPNHDANRRPTRPPRRSKSTAEGLRVRTEAPPPAFQRRVKDEKTDSETPLFSPFPFYFRGQDFPSEKRGEKTMIGEKGWLERTDKSPDIVKKGHAKRMGILDGIKKIARDMTELHHPSRRSQQAAKEPLTTKVLISLDAREQSLLYGELEFHLTNALNSYITVQLEKGRLITDKLKKIGDAWLQQGRPRVVGFRYDLETQLELVNLHIDGFVFSGRRQGNPVEIAGLLHAMKVNARAMRIRTFCQPDSVIAKQLVDAQSLFNMLGVARADDLALAEIAQFFKVCIEREQNIQERESRRARKSRVEHQQRHGGEQPDGRVAEDMQPGARGSSADDEWLFCPT